MNNIVVPPNAPSFEKLSPFETVNPSLSSHFYEFCSKNNESNKIWIGRKWNPAKLGANKSIRPKGIPTIIFYGRDCYGKTDSMERYCTW